MTWQGSDFVRRQHPVAQILELKIAWKSLEMTHEVAPAFQVSFSWKRLKMIRQSDPDRRTTQLLQVPTLPQNLKKSNLPAVLLGFLVPTLRDFRTQGSNIVVNPALLSYV